MNELNIKEVNFNKLIEDIKLKDDINPQAHFKAYMVTTNWTDSADSTCTTKDFLVTDLSEPVLGKAVHDALSLPWLSNDHGYDQTWYNGFDLEAYDFANGWHKDNPWRNLLDYLNEIDKHNSLYNSSTYIKHFDVLCLRIENKQPVIYFAQTKNIEDAVCNLVDTREKYNKKQAKIKRQNAASAKLSDIIKTINQMPQKDKESVLKSLLK